MEFNIIDENNKFKIGNVISIFKLPDYEEQFVLFSVSDFDEDNSLLQVAYLRKDSEGYDYIDEIEDTEVLKNTGEAVKEMIKMIG